MTEADFNNHLLQLAATILVPLAGLLITLWKLNKIAEIKVQQPLKIEMERSFTSRESFHKHAELNRLHHERIEARIDALERRREADKDAIITAGEERSIKIHDRINVLIDKVGELRGEMNAR